MRTILMAFAGVVALSGAALAQGVTTGQLDAMDTDDDGAVSAAEFDAFMTQAFAQIDANGDGYVTQAESAGFMSAEQWSAANTNGDDGVGQAEFLAAAQGDFASADRDGNGALD